MACEYSPNERRLISEFGYGNLCNHAGIMPGALYHMCMEVAFVTDMRGPAVDSLRRVIDAFAKSTPYRQTPEFEALIDF